MNFSFQKILLVTLTFFLFSSTVHAQASILDLTQTLNAGVVSNIWYSSTNINEGDSIKIYSGFYNSSATKIESSALYYVDDTEIQEVPFVAPPNSLVQIEGFWKATSGSHSLQVKIATTTSPLTNSESQKSTLSIQKQMTLQSVQADTQNIINNTASAIDPLANKLADNLVALGNSFASTTATSTSKFGKTATSSPSSATSIKNTVIKAVVDGAAFLVRHWAWTGLGLVVLYFILKPRRRKKSWW